MMTLLSFMILFFFLFSLSRGLLILLILSKNEFVELELSAVYLLSQSNKRRRENWSVGSLIICLVLLVWRTLSTGGGSGYAFIFWRSRTSVLISSWDLHTSSSFTLCWALLPPAFLSDLEVSYFMLEIHEYVESYFRKYMCLFNLRVMLSVLR